MTLRKLWVMLTVLIACGMFASQITAQAAQTPAKHVKHSETKSSPTQKTTEPSQEKQLSEEQTKLNSLVTRYEMDHAILSSYREWLGYYGAQEDTARAKETEAKIQALQAKIKDDFESFLKEFPNNAAAYSKYGDATLDVFGDPDRAAELWQKAVALDKAQAEAHNNLGIYYSEHNEPVSGFEEYRKAIELRPNEATYHFNISQSYYLYRPQLMKAYGWTYNELFDKVLEESKKARDLDPVNFDYAQDYARSFFGASDFGVAPNWDEAVTAWKYCIEKFPEESQKTNVKLNLGRAYLQKGDKTAARQIFEELQREDPNDGVVANLIKLTQQ